MPAISEEAYFKLSRSARDAFNGVLLYGNDASQVSAAQRRVMAAHQADEEPLSLTMAAVRSDPSLLEAAVHGMSLFGGRRLITLDDVDESAFRFVGSLFAFEGVANFVVMLAGSLGKSSALRTATESSPKFHAIGFYEETDAEFLARANRLLQSAGLIVEDGVAARLVELSGGDRGVLEGEVSKLALYVEGKERVMLEDVEALCGDASAFDVTTLLESMLSGDFQAVETALSAARANDETAQMLNALKWPLDRMQALRGAFEASSNWEQAFARARPPVHFKLKDRWKNLLSRTSMSQLDSLQRRVQETILLGRKNAGIADAMVERFVYASTREMRANQR